MSDDIHIDFRGIRIGSIAEDTECLKVFLNSGVLHYFATKTEDNVAVLFKHDGHRCIGLSRNDMGPEAQYLVLDLDAAGDANGIPDEIAAKLLASAANVNLNENVHPTFKNNG